MMMKDLVVVCDEGRVEGVITIFAEADRAGRRKSKAKAGAGRENLPESPLLAKAARSGAPTVSTSQGKSKADSLPGYRPVRNDKCCAETSREGSESKADSSPGLRPTRNDIGVGLRTGRNDILRKMEPKELGEIAEAEFLNTVLRKGIAVAKPWGESQGYDFILDDEGRLHRVQVKAAFRQGKERGYSLRAYRSSKQSYTAKDMDVLAGYVDPEKVWYLFPVKAIKKLRSLKLFPGSKKGRSKHEKWREAWWLVRK